MKIKLAGTILVLSAALLGSTSCSQSDDSGTASMPSESAVVLKNIAFDPPLLEVSAGDEVTWTNDDESVVHTVTAGRPGTDSVPGVSEGKPAKVTGEFDSGEMEAGDEFSFTFDEAGTYAYFCEIHPSMVAEISVS